MVSHIHAFVRVRPLLPREFAQSTSEAVSVYEVTTPAQLEVSHVCAERGAMVCVCSGPKDQGLQGQHCSGVRF